MTTLHTEVPKPFPQMIVDLLNEIVRDKWENHEGMSLVLSATEALEWIRTPQPDAAAIRKQFMDDLLNAVSAEMAEWTGDFRKPVTTAFSDMLARLQFTTLVEPVTDHIRDATKMIPDGYVLVPVEPTDAMREAGMNESPLCIKKMFLHDSPERAPRYTGQVSGFDTEGVGDIYKAMIAAAPIQIKDE